MTEDESYRRHGRPMSKEELTPDQDAAGTELDAPAILQATWRMMMMMMAKKDDDDGGPTLPKTWTCCSHKGHDE